MKKLMLLFVVIIFCSSCCTIFLTPEQAIKINSTPPGASVIVDYDTIGQTPLIADLKRINPHIIEIHKPGFKPYEITLTKSISPVVVLNLIAGGVVGYSIDKKNGSMYILKPNNVFIILKKEIK